MSLHELEKKIDTLIREEVPGIDYSESETMADDGLLDSMSLTGILGTLSEEFDLEIPYDDILPANFNSIRTIAELMKRLIDAKEAK